MNDKERLIEQQANEMERLRGIIERLQKERDDFHDKLVAQLDRNTRLKKERDEMEERAYRLDKELEFFHPPIKGRDSE